MLAATSSYGQPDKTDPYFVETRDTVSTRGPIYITPGLEDKKGNIWKKEEGDFQIFKNYGR